jgi:NAD(P) transhydrogenase subunit alpha
MSEHEATSSEQAAAPMIIGVPKETQKDEKRVALTPETATRIQKLGYKLKIQKGAGDEANFSDQAYEEAGVQIVSRVGDLWKGSDIIMKVRPPTDAEVKRLAADKTLISFLYPGQNEALLKTLNEQKPEAVMAMDMVPRISRAQKLDALSSMAITISGCQDSISALASRALFSQNSDSGWRLVSMLNCSISQFPSRTERAPLIFSACPGNSS